MATVQGPLHSDRADGTVNNQLTYKETRRGATVCPYSYPGSRHPFTPSAAQRTIRTRTGIIMKAWRTLDLAEQETWIAPAHELSLQPINIFQRVNFKRLADGLDLARTYPPGSLPAGNTFAAKTFAANALRTVAHPT